MICEKYQQTKDNLKAVVLLRKFGKDSEEIVSNYESGGRTFESFRARHFIRPRSRRPGRLQARSRRVAAAPAQILENNPMQSSRQPPEPALVADARHVGQMCSRASSPRHPSERWHAHERAAAHGREPPFRPAGTAVSTEKQAVADVAKMDKRLGMRSADMQEYKDLNRDLVDPSLTAKVRGLEAYATGGPNAQQPHGHVGPVDHIPIVDVLP